MYRISKIKINHLRLRLVVSSNLRYKSSTPPSTTRLYLSPLAKDSFLNGSNAVFIDSLYDQWRSDEESVDPSWRKYFSESSYGMDSTVSGTAEQLNVNETVADHLRVQNLIRFYQHLGHHIAALDPLNLYNADLDPSIPDELKISSYSNSEDDLQRYFTLPDTTRIGGDVTVLKLQEIYDRLRKVYCGSIGVEYMHITDPKITKWIRKKFEPPGVAELSREEKLKVLSRLVHSAGFENFLNQKWSTEKRFGCEGCEVISPAVQEIVDRSAQLGVNSFLVGMSHRGRLNVIANVAKQSLAKIFSRFKRNLSFQDVADQGMGDVNYHLGMSCRPYNEAADKFINFLLSSNPSHLEAVNPVVQGRTRAEQFFYDGEDPKKEVMSILIHGDAAFAGQGVVYETIQLSDVENYSTGGSIHLIVNNQIGFTTDPNNGRSSAYCTDVAKIVNAPIFHVNADNPEAVIYVSRVAAEFREAFQKDVFIDLVCYRRYGHNEMDNPEFTHPVMYHEIKTKTKVLPIYAEKLINENVTSMKEYLAMVKSYSNMCKEAAEQAGNRSNFWHFDDSDFVNNNESNDTTLEAGVDRATLEYIGKEFSKIPKDFTVHNTLKGVLMKRQKLLEMGIVDWALGESMAFGSLLKDGIHVRLSGQDVERGTFSHRHHILHHQQSKSDCPKEFTAFDNLFKKQARYTVCNSILAEYAVLGFETGYSMSRPNTLVCWEAQFGDFHNVAQVIIDQFISSGQEKWGYQTGIVLLLPHGYEGMGPEHSSARLERFLQLCNDDMDVVPDLSTDEKIIKQIRDYNLQVVNCSTPANYFHALRRQFAYKFRKPLIIMTPKSLLRLTDAVSPLEDMEPGTSFKRVIPEAGIASQEDNRDAIKRLMFCSGKVYYELHTMRKSKGFESSVAISRIEQLFPFPYDLVQEEIEKYPNAEIAWCQEEPKNMGAWIHVQTRINNLTKYEKRIRYIGRKPSGSVAAGIKKDHDIQQAELLANALDV